MASDRLRAILDDLGRASGARREELRALAATAAAADNPLGLRFAHQARVLDLATGTKAIVTRGERDPLTGGGRYALRLDDGRLVYRVDSELEPDPTPAAPLGS